MITQCLTEYAKIWFYFIKKDIDSYEKFEELFKKSFWIVTVQNGLRGTLTSGAYVSSGNLTRVNYATRLFGIAEDLNVSENERHNITISNVTLDIVIQHFAVDVRRLVRSLRICTRDDFLELLRQFDDEDQFLKNNK